MKVERFYKQQTAMIRHTDGYYYEDGNEREKFPFFEFIGTVIVVSLVLWLLSSCSTKKVSVDIERTDSAAMVQKERTDSVAVRTVYKDRFVDHYVNNLIMVSPNGDTLREKTFERLEITSNTYQHDSIVRLQAQVDSLTRLKKQYLCKTVERKLSWWEQTKIDTYEFVLIALLACIVVIVGYIFYRVKK